MDVLPVADDEDAPLAGRDLELRQGALAGLDLVGGGKQRRPAAFASSSARAESSIVDAATLPWSSNTTAAWIWEEISVRSASACWASMPP